MSWRFHRRNVLFGLIACGGIVQFVVAANWAIQNYPGGYRFAEHFLSDLGRNRTIHGVENADCAYVFSRSIVAMGISLMPFFSVMAETFPCGRAWLRYSGVLSATGLVAIGLTPYDDYFLWHHVALALWIGPMLVMVVAFFLLARSEDAGSVWLSVGSIGVAIGSLGYILAGDHVGHVVLQKLLICVTIVWFLAMVFTVSLETVFPTSQRRDVAEAQARRYLQRIRRGHRRGAVPGLKPHQS